LLSGPQAQFSAPSQLNLAALQAASGKNPLSLFGFHFADPAPDPSSPGSALIRLLPAGTFATSAPAGKGAGPLFQGLDVSKLSLEPLSARLLTEKSPAFPGVASPLQAPRLARFDIQVLRILPDEGRILTAEGKPVPKIQAQIPSGFAGEIDATVEGFTHQGLPVLSLILPGSKLPQSFILQFSAADVEPGAHLAVLPQPDAAAALTAKPEGLQDMQWPALQELVTALNHIAPQAAQTLAQVLPSPALPQQLPAAALLFVATVQAGDFSGWLGDKTIDLLRRSGKSDLIQRLAQDADTISRAEPAAQDWKSMPLPLYYDGQMQRAMLWYRRDEGAGKEKSASRQTRFIFDLDLTRMGAVQLDGLAKPQRIDLIVRTLKPVSSSMRQIMRRKYLAALEHAQFTGELSFQDKPEQFVKIEGRKAGQAFRV
jgi:hypothetical protein